MGNYIENNSNKLYNKLDNIIHAKSDTKFYNKFYNKLDNIIHDKTYTKFYNKLNIKSDNQLDNKHVNNDTDLDYCYVCDNIILIKYNKHCTKCNKCHNKYKNIYCNYCNTCINHNNDFEILSHKKKCKIYY